MMNLDRFRALAESFGGDLARWPVGEREAGEAFLAAQGQVCRDILEEAARLDEALRTLEAPTPPEALFNAVMASAPSPAQSGVSQRSRWAAMAAAVCLTVGLGAGWSFAPSPQAASSDDLFAAAFGALEDQSDFTDEGDV